MLQPQRTPVSTRLVPHTKLIGCASVGNGVPAERFSVVRVSTFKLSNAALRQPEAQNLLNDIQALTTKEHTMKIESERRRLQHSACMQAPLAAARQKSFIHAGTDREENKERPRAVGTEDRLDNFSFPVNSEGDQQHCSSDNDVDARVHRHRGGVACISWLAVNDYEKREERVHHHLA